MFVEPQDRIGASKAGWVGGPSARTGLVHISGVEDPTVSFADMLDARRVLVGPRGRLGAIEPLRRLYAGGFDGIVSFEPFAEDVDDVADPIEAARAGMAYVREALAMS
jgi:2-keto-myo-inositol isomerase